MLPRGAAVRRIPFGLARGLAMEVDFSYQSRLYAGIFEIELARHVRSLCRPGASCFDVGAREGYYTLVLAGLSRGGRVLALEFDPSWCKLLERNLDANLSLAPRPEVRTAHVAERTDEARGDVSLDDVAYGEDGFVPGLIKMDIEGGEAAALRGARRLMRQAKPILLLELHEAQSAESVTVFDELRQMGYEVRRLARQYPVVTSAAGLGRKAYLLGLPPGGFPMTEDA